ncbi:MAG: Stp1/IreP family PP2C-type Ser/Thr phosphatase [Oscillospiraceae bacterium]|nr:Stp1/IreP family PP2C-type Ser/Thr phosphatase [Oscillospiraceae bacterium]
MEAWGLTDPGKVRSQNQDYYDLSQLEDGSILAVVCDGMGGAKAGNIASRLAVDVFAKEVRRNMDPRLSGEEICQMLKDAVALSNTAVNEHAQLSDEYVGMGTTLVAALVREKKAYIVNVGDSRAYHMSPEGIRMITVDHSVVEMMVRRGEITREEAKQHPVKNLITRAVGTEESVLCDVFTQTLKAGDSLLLCSDGLSNMMADQEILFEVEHGADRSDCCKRLLMIATNRGAPDNVTVVLIAV